MPNKYISHLILGLMLIFNAQGLYSQAFDNRQTQNKGRLYQVEIIAYQIKQSLDNETFSPYPALPELSKAVELQANTDKAETYALLPRTQHALNREENLLSKKENYQILFHYSWLQRQDDEKKVLLMSDDINTPSIKGTIEIHRGYYYFTNLKLDFQDDEHKTQHYVLNSDRKLKNKEMHYIDHPKFGVLLQITTL